MNVIGKIHCAASFAASGGPGVRYIVSMQGCPLRCVHCHHPDSCDVSGGMEISDRELFEDILRYKDDIRAGGVTFSGGEPLMQSDFLNAVTARLKEEQIHVAVDTSGAIALERAQPVLEKSDLLLLDIKTLDTADEQQSAGVFSKNAQDYLALCEKMGKPVWIRYVLVSGTSLSMEMLEMLAERLSTFRCIERVALIPLCNLGKVKRSLDCELQDVLPPTEQEIIVATNIFREYKLL